MLVFTKSFDRRLLRFVFLCAAVTGASLEAQQPRRASPSEIAEIVRATLQAVIPREKLLTDFTVAERGVRFDFGQTMAAFGYVAGDSTARSSLKTLGTLPQGTSELLSDCNQAGTKPCKLLGKAVYATLRPISVTDSEAVVWLSIRWVGASTPKASFLSGVSTEIHLSRSGTGPWRYVSSGDGVIF